MRIHFLVILLASIVCTAQSWDVYQIDTLHAVHGHVIDETLVVFDLDNTLFMPKDEVNEQQQTVKGQLGSDQWVDSMCRICQFNEFEQLYLAIQEKIDMQLAEGKNTLHVIQTLQERGVQFMGLTARSAPLAQRTHVQLKALGIHFDANKPHHENIQFDAAGRVIYVDGITFCSGTSKGDALREFLVRTGLRPARIVMVDDKDKYPRDVKVKVGKAFDIDVVGLHYTYLKNRIENFDAQVAYKELTDLVEKHPEMANLLPKQLQGSIPHSHAFA